MIVFEPAPGATRARRSMVEGLLASLDEAERRMGAISEEIVPELRERVTLCSEHFIADIGSPSMLQEMERLEEEIQELFL